MNYVLQMYDHILDQYSLPCADYFWLCCAWQLLMMTMMMTKMKNHRHLLALVDSGLFHHPKVDLPGMMHCCAASLNKYLAPIQL